MSNEQSSIGRWLTLGGVMTLLGTTQCGNTTHTPGAETHWLAMCTADADCAGLRCLCGVCTEDCGSDEACQSLADTAVCAPASATGLAAECEADPKLCVRASDVAHGSGGSPATANSTDGGAAGSGGSGASGTSWGAAGAGGAAGAAACSAQDVRGGGGSCERILGSGWNGEACETLSGCECEGADCGELSATHDECSRTHAGCFDDQVCSDERREIAELLNANKSCTYANDCVTHFVGCGVSEDDCTDAVYSNAELDREEVRRLGARLGTCIGAFEPEFVGCVTCYRNPRLPSCIDGRCIGADACALERSVMSAFMSNNDACETADDCATEVVGCGVSENDCTGAVYLREGFDSVEFNRLRSALYACAADAESCSSCEREIAPAACVSGRCQPE